MQHCLLIWTVYVIDVYFYEAVCLLCGSMTLFQGDWFLRVPLSARALWNGFKFDVESGRRGFVIVFNPTSEFGCFELYYRTYTYICISVDALCFSSVKLISQAEER